MAVFIYLLHLKKVYEKIYSKKYHFVKQSLCKLETEEAEVAKIGSIPTVVETTDILGVESPVFKAHWLPLTDPFAFNFSFFQLPDLLSYNTLQPFLLCF